MGSNKRLPLLLHMQKYPEKLYFEGLAEQVNPPMQLQPQYLPIYFGNVCLRFLPVFDIVIHRFLELLPVSKSLETLLDHLGGLYKFHGEEKMEGSVHVEYLVTIVLGGEAYVGVHLSSDWYLCQDSSVQMANLRQKKKVTVVTSRRSSQDHFAVCYMH